MKSFEVLGKLCSVDSPPKNIIFFFLQMASSTLKKVSFLDDIPTSTLSGENLNMDPETAKKLFEIGATIFLVTKHQP